MIYRSLISIFHFSYDFCIAVRLFFFWVSTHFSVSSFEFHFVSIPNTSTAYTYIAGVWNVLELVHKYIQIYILFVSHFSCVLFSFQFSVSLSLSILCLSLFSLSLSQLSVFFHNTRRQHCKIQSYPKIQEHLFQEGGAHALHSQLISITITIANYHNGHTVYSTQLLGLSVCVCYKKLQ